MKDGTVNIVCMKWKKEDGTDKFGPDYVNRLYRMVEKNLTLPHRFVCFTDDAAGLDGGIESFPLPAVKLRANLPERGWKKLGLLSETLGDLSGTALFLDLDVVIVGNMDDFFTAPGEFLIARDRAGCETVGNSSVFRFQIGKHADVLKFFEDNFDEIRQQVRHEQAYMSREMIGKGIFQFWPSGWCVSFKHDVMLPFPLNWLKTPLPPSGAKVVIFHGNPNPDVVAERPFTAKFGLRHVRPLPWVKNLWLHA